MGETGTNGTNATNGAAAATVEITPTDPGAEISARLAHLRYVADDGPGIRRRRAGSGFTYWSDDGRRVRDADTIARIRKLVIPPAWTDVWICPIANGHIQATGRDARRRKQYRYHQRWREVRDDVKYGRLLAFGAALPSIRRRVEKDFQQTALTRTKVIATIVQLLEKTLIRVGNEEYARENNSFGLTTMKDRHAEVKGSTVIFEFRAKSGVQQCVDLRDARLARVIKRCQDLPGQTLFQYIDEEGARQSVDSSDVNDYLRQVTGQDFTAKDFRTWAGTVMTAQALHALEMWETEAQAKKNVVEAIAQVAKKLGNTRAVCRRCYIHPAVLDAYQEGITIREVVKRHGRAMRRFSGLSREEIATLALLEHRLKKHRLKARRARRERSKAA
jgi:DNA topoisomerase I